MINTNEELNIANLSISGIYVIKNKLTDMCYIGCSKNIINRWFTHINSPSCYSKLYEDMAKYGLTNFTFMILEKVEIEYLLIKEAYYINLYLENKIVLYNTLKMKSKPSTKRTKRISARLIVENIENAFPSNYFD